MKNKLKLMLAVVLSLVMVMGLSLTAFSATVVMRNPNAAGVQLIGDTLVIQEDHHNFFVWGKSVMIQCPGVTDILPNNVTNMVDIQFNGNLYKEIREVLIVSMPGKDDKVRLEEGSMIITGVTTPEQVQNVRTAIASQPNNLVALKTALTGVSQDLSVTKNYIVGKHNAVQNENGNRVATKDIQGTAEIVGDQEVVQTIVEEAKASASESKPAEEKKEPAPTPTCNHSSGYECYSTTTHKCKTCKNEFVHVFTANDEKHSCTLCNEQEIPHTYNAGVCSICNHSCTHGGKVAGQTCDYCHMTVPCSVDHSQHCSEWTCACGQKGTRSAGTHKFVNGTCECGEYCSMCHNDATQINVGSSCLICGLAGTKTPACSSGMIHSDHCTGWQCECGEWGTGISEACHQFYHGECEDCHAECPGCGGNSDNIIAGKNCEKCNLSGTGVCPSEGNHAALHIGIECPEGCGYVGTASHTWYDPKDLKGKHKCACGAEAAHDWEDAVCAGCGLCYLCKGEGLYNGCWNCGKEKPYHDCSKDGHEWQADNTCSYCGVTKCEAEGHTWSSETGRCTVCNIVCPTCISDGGYPDPCVTCHKLRPFICPNSGNHSSLHEGVACSNPSCDYVGVAPHNWYADTIFNVGTHKCDCGAVGAHDWTKGVCSVCGPCYLCHGLGASSKCAHCECYPYFPDECPVNHGNYCTNYVCTECGEHGTGNHVFSYGYCMSCWETCPDCQGDNSNVPVGQTCSCGMEGPQS